MNTTNFSYILQDQNQQGHTSITLNNDVSYLNPSTFSSMFNQQDSLQNIQTECVISNGIHVQTSNMQRHNNNNNNNQRSMNTNEQINNSIQDNQYFGLPNNQFIDYCSNKNEPFFMAKIPTAYYEKLTFFFKQINSPSSENTNALKVPKQSDDLSDDSSNDKRSNKGDSVIKGSWSEIEDEKLLQLVKKHGPKRWSFIASHLEGRVGKQCRERYLNHLDPKIKKNAWTEEEDSIIIEMHEKHGNQWAKISKFLEGRTANAIKNHWNSTLSKRLDKKKGEEQGDKQLLEQTQIQMPQQSIPVQQMVYSSVDTSMLKEGLRTDYADQIPLSCKSDFADFFTPTPQAAENTNKRTFPSGTIESLSKKIKTEELQLETEETLNSFDSGKEKFKKLRLNLIEKSDDVNSSSTVICHDSGTPGISGVSVITEHMLPSGFTPKGFDPSPSGLSLFSPSNFNDGATPSSTSLGNIWMDTDGFFSSPKSTKNV
ncbi:hypothetical protein NAEGRDRAFT_79798 [Naegleria gruberi]|uniref:Uncharacterized protein n=1 Tax=Naegleria gruberi TaxID=5762 RepID=D2VFR0_NAEGR|nr:uncharacterized protein NAEGRDRAFT_79798 [Naegleria gruberi]EFC44400.1 hypothetical protein NAEGRDRAFT_79798 [Naegleria gruberi]|eukprot:XP_002677144.1 hypothetical protein NAEGRDRAFT_79798 [Naegleria gruberi strain NEG-M]